MTFRLPGRTRIEQEDGWKVSDHSRHDSGLPGYFCTAWTQRERDSTPQNKKETTSETKEKALHEIWDLSRAAICYASNFVCKEQAFTINCTVVIGKRKTRYRIPDPASPNRDPQVLARSRDIDIFLRTLTSSRPKLLSSRFMDLTTVPNLWHINLSA